MIPYCKWFYLMQALVVPSTTRRLNSKIYLKKVNAIELHLKHLKSVKDIKASSLIFYLGILDYLIHITRKICNTYL